MTDLFTPKWSSLIWNAPTDKLWLIILQTLRLNNLQNYSNALETQYLNFTPTDTLQLETEQNSVKIEQNEVGKKSQRETEWLQLHAVLVSNVQHFCDMDQVQRKMKLLTDVSMCLSLSFASNAELNDISSPLRQRPCSNSPWSSTCTQHYSPTCKWMSKLLLTITAELFHIIP